MTQKETTPETHSYISASNTNIWCPYEGDGCTAMGLLQKQLVEDGILDFSRRDETETEFQKFGNVVHDIGANYILALFSGEKKLEDLAQASDEEYMAYCYAEWVFKTYGKLENHAVEEKFFIKEDIGGTNDFSAYDPDIKRLPIIDLKTGQRKVWAEGNSQGLFYGCGILPNYPETKTVQIGIYQPNEGGYPIDLWEVPVEVVLKYKEKVLKVIDKIEKGDVEFKPDSRCHWCKAKPFCPALANNFTDVLRIIK